MENIRLNRNDVTDDKIKEICRFLNIDTFIERLPKGYGEVVGERGLSISAGQRQLLAFARALLSNPPILILDEATANIDTETELLIQQALRKSKIERTTIVIAHRLSTIRDADRIIVLHKGVQRETGTHQELLDLKGIYYNLYQLQYKET
jgi:ABC-type multidrug transport system fused ATPase/permease subunit